MTIKLQLSIQISININQPFQTKDVCHIWELGGGAVFSALLTTPLTHRTISSSAAIIVLDLSKPETLWNHLELLLNEIKASLLLASINNFPSVFIYLYLETYNVVGV